jgi:hypothetical protein
MVSLCEKAATIARSYPPLSYVGGRVGGSGVWGNYIVALGPAI